MSEGNGEDGDWNVDRVGSREESRCSRFQVTEEGRDGCATAYHLPGG